MPYLSSLGMTISSDWVIAGATAISTMATIAVAVFAYMTVQANKGLVQANKDLVQTSHEQIKEIQIDRELAHRPYLVCKPSRDLTQPAGPAIRVFEISNVGKGPALHGQLFLFDPVGHGQWYTTEVFHLAADSAKELEIAGVDIRWRTEKGKRELVGLEEGNQEIAVLVCDDQFGKHHRFRSGQTEPEIRSDEGSPHWISWSQWRQPM